MRLAGRAADAQAELDLTLQRLGGREDPAPERPPGAGLPGVEAHPVAPVSVLRLDQPAARAAGRLGAQRRRPGEQAGGAHPGDDRSAAARHLHRQAPLRRRLERHRHLDRRAALRHHQHGRAQARGEVSPLRHLRPQLLQWLGPEERHAPADPPRLQLQRRPPGSRSRRPGARVLADQARLQADQIPHLADLHGREARRLLGGPGVSMARRGVKPLLLFSCLVVGLAVVATVAAAEEDRTLHLALGDPARKDGEAPLGLDAVTDTRTGDLLTPADLPARLAHLEGVRLVLVGESHTNADFHLAQLRVIQELQRAGREVLIGLEMYPETEQRWLDAWRDGSLTEDGFLRLSHWYKNWGYNWAYYRDIFLFARDHGLRMIALNAPREIVSAVGKKGLAGLTPDERASIAPRIDTTSAEHRTLINAFFGAGDPLHSGMPQEQLDRMYAAQCTWDATMGHNAVKALREHPGPN